MGKVDKRFIDLGTTGNQVNSRVVPAHFTPSNYTPAQVGSEGADKVSSHLNGIDTALGEAGGTLGKYTSTQAASGSWAADGNLYKQEVTLPGSLTMSACIIQAFINGTNQIAYPDIEEGSVSTKFYIWTNDNSITYDFVIIG